MKRSTFLVPLSWEHHNALLNANRLQKGLANQTEINILLEFSNFVWQQDLLPHFEREENIIMKSDHWPKVDESLRKQVLAEHRAMADLVKQMNEENEESLIREELGQLAESVIRHVRFEERELFPAIEKEFDLKELQRIEQALRKAHVPGCTTWNPKFWETK